MSQKVKAQATKECMSIGTREEEDVWHTEISNSAYALFPALLNIRVNDNSKVLTSVSEVY